MGSQKADAVLQFINKDFITLQDDDKKYYNGHYLKVLEEFFDQMKFHDELFNAIYEKPVFSGSYYDGLKISRPEEYDVDVVMRLPVNYDTLELKCKKVSAGFVKVRATEIDNATSDPRNNNVYKDMSSWTDKDGFLLQDKFRTWMFSVVDKTIASLTKENCTCAELAIGDETYQKLRDTSGLKKVVSYYIKTIFLTSVDEEADTYWTNTSLSLLFMDMLNKLSQCFAKRKIGYYWNDNNNLLTGSGMSDVEMADIHKYLEDIIVDINKKMAKDPNIFARYILTEAEFRKFKREYTKMDDPATNVNSINDDRGAAQLEIENRAMKKQLNQMKKDNEALAQQIESIVDVLNTLSINFQNIDNRLERCQGGVGHLFSVVKRNPYF